MEMKNDIIPNKENKDLLKNLENLQTVLNERILKISELENDILDFQNKNKKLERENRILKTSVEYKEQDLQKNDDEIQKLFKDKICLQNECQELKRTLQNTNDKLVYENIINDCLIEFPKRQDLKQSLNSKEYSIEEKDKIIDEYKLKSTEFQEKLKEKSESFDEEIEKRNIEMEKQNKTIDYLRKEINNLKTDNESKLKSSDALVNTVYMDCGSLHAESQIQQIEKLNKSDQLNLKQIQNEVTNDENYKELLESLKSKRAELRERDEVITELESNISDLEQKNRKLERELRVLKKKVEDMSQELQESESLKDETEKKCKSLRKEFKDYKNKCQNEEDVQKYVDEIKNLKQSLKSKENSVNEKDKIIDEHKLKLKNSEEKLKDKTKTLEEEIGKRNIEMEKQNTSMEELKRQVETLKSDNDKKQQAIVNMREKIKVKNEGAIDPVELRKLQNQLKGKENEIEGLHSKVENLNKAFDDKCDEHDLAKKKINQLESEITNMKKLNFGKGKHESVSKPPESPFPAWWSKHMKK